MSTKTVAPTNGKANETKTTVVSTVPTTAKVTLIRIDAPEKKEEEKLPPVEDRILKVNQLFSLVEKHETLLETKKKLKSFKLSTDGSRDVLQIRDSKGNEFMTSNSGCIADVLEVLKVSIDKKINEVEAQIKF